MHSPVIFSTRAGTIVQAGSNPARFHVIDRNGQDLTEGLHVDMATAFRTLASLTRHRPGSDQPNS